MAKILVSISGNRLTPGKDFNIFPFYEGLLNSLKRNGNDVDYMIVNEFVHNYTSRNNQISEKIDQNKLNSFLKSRNYDLIIAFNNAIVDSCLCESDIPYIVWGVDPISVFANKEELKRNKDRYHFAGNCEDDISNINEYFKPKNAFILRFATDIRAENVLQDYPISFCGSLWNGSEIDLIRSGLDKSNLRIIISELRNNTNITLEELKAKCPSQRNLLDSTTIFWLLHGIAATDRIRVLSSLVDLGLNCFGLSDLWIDLAKTNLTLASTYSSKIIYTITELQGLLNRSKISFNMSHIHAKESGFSFRVLDSMASNACLVTDRKNCYKQLFAGLDLPTFSYGNEKEARSVCEYILNHDKERNEIVMNAQKIINEKFRFEHRFSSIENIVGIKLLNTNDGILTRIHAKNFYLLPSNNSVPFPNNNISKSSEMNLCDTLKKQIQSITEIKNDINILNNRILDLTKDITGKSYNNLSNQKVVSNNYLEENNNFYKYAYLNKFANFHKASNDKIKIVFLFQEASFWPSMQSLYELLSSDCRFCVYVVLIPTLQPPKLDKYELKKSNIDYLENKGIPFIDSRTPLYFDISTLKPDYVFIQLHFDVQRPLIYRSYIMRMYTKVCLIPHAFLLSQSDNRELIYQQDLYRIFVPDEVHKKILASVIKRDDNISVTGFPKFDLYSKQGEESIWKLKDKSVKKILWTPHWWAYGHSQKLADDFFKIWDYLFEICISCSNIEIIIKPHPSLFNGLVASNYISKHKLDSLINSFSSLKNGQIYTGADYFELFKSCDLIINNSISFLAEFLPSGKPMIFFDTERYFQLNDTAKEILKAYYHADSLYKLNSLIREILFIGNDYMKPIRNLLIDKMNFTNTNAAKNIMDFIVAENSTN